MFEKEMSQEQRKVCEAAKVAKKHCCPRSKGNTLFTIGPNHTPLNLLLADSYKKPSHYASPSIFVLQFHSCLFCVFEAKMWSAEWQCAFIIGIHLLLQMK